VHLVTCARTRLWDRQKPGRLSTRLPVTMTSVAWLLKSNMRYIAVAFWMFMLYQVCNTMYTGSVVHNQERSLTICTTESTCFSGRGEGKVRGRSVTVSYPMCGCQIGTTCLILLAK
jgi:hypothetical protein